MKHLLFVVESLAISVSLLAAGCSTRSSEIGPTIVSEEASVATLANLDCEPEFTCSCESSSLDTLAKCRADRSADLQASLEDATAAGLVYDGACVGAAVDSTAALGCTTFDDHYFGAQTACSYCNYYHGDVPESGACTWLQIGPRSISNCGRGLRCTGDVCVDPCKFAQLGESCATTSCAQELYCDDSSANPTCRSPHALGESCSEVGSCEDDTFCDYSTQTCAASKGVGSPCRPISECQGFSCYKTDCPIRLVCVDSFCEAQLSAGSPCEADGRCLSLKCVGGVCERGVGESPYVCNFPAAGS